MFIFIQEYIKFRLINPIVVWPGLEIFVLMSVKSPIQAHIEDEVMGF